MDNEQNIYVWQKYTPNGYSQVNLQDSNSTSYSISPPNLTEELRKITSLFYKTYSQTKIPKENNKLLISLLELYGIETHLDSYVTIGCALQYTHQINYNNEMDSVTEDFNTTKRDYKNFLEVLEKYILLDNKKNAQSISFKFRNKTHTISNTFILNDVYKALLNQYDINIENYQIRKEDILSKTNQIKVEKYDEKVKTDFAQLIYNNIKSPDLKQADVVKFIGTFFTLFEVPTNNNFQRIELYENINDFKESIDLKNFSHYITRPPKLNHQ
ncbi:MAG: hypothetical protein ACK4IX_03115 [Candidatus Sericytochromatia bacterium]